MHKATWTWGSALVAVCLLACGDDDGSNAGGIDAGGDDAGVKTVSMMVGPAGATVELPSGGKVEIPEGALTQSLMITVSEKESDEIAAVPDNLEPAGKGFAFEPHGTQFAQPIKITVPYEGSDVDVRPLKLPNEMADTSEWTTVFPSEKDMAMKLVSFDTRGFSVYQAARPRRSSGVITLPDGAIVGEDAGTDAMVSDAGMDAAMVDRCSVNNGGCDVLVTCSDDGDPQVSCGACPTSYVGDGVAGCTPLLTDLALSAGVLSPALDDTTLDHVASVDLLQTTITLTPSAPSDASVSINGMNVAAGAAWTSPHLELGANAIVITLQRGTLTRTYRLVVTRQTAAQTDYIKASDSASSHNFGTSVAIDGDTMVVGAIGAGSNVGAAYVFTRNANAWVEQAILTGSNSESGDYFGTAVAISGDRIVVGASGEDSDGTGGSNNSVGESGAAYVFVRSGTQWMQQALLKASNPGDYANFGTSVAIDGTTIVVGASGESSDAVGIGGTITDNTQTWNSGAVYVFTFDGSAWSAPLHVKASNRDAYDYFGTAVAISGDTFAVGAFGESSAAAGINGNQTDNNGYSSGAAYVFDRSGGTWMQTAYVKAAVVHSGDHFGTTVALDGDSLAVGAEYESSDASGINGDATNINAPYSGAAYVFVRNAGTWSQQAYIKQSNPEMDGNVEDYDAFGRRLDLDGDTLIVAASGEDSAAIGINGNQSDNTAQYAGAAYVFQRAGSTWSQVLYVKASNTEEQDGFAEGVAVGDSWFAASTPYEASAATGINNTSPGQGDNSAGYSGAVYVFR